MLHCNVPQRFVQRSLPNGKHCHRSYKRSRVAPQLMSQVNNCQNYCLCLYVLMYMVVIFDVCVCVCAGNKILVVVNDERTCYQLREVKLTVLLHV